MFRGLSLFIRRARAVFLIGLLATLLSGCEAMHKVDVLNMGMGYMPLETLKTRYETKESRYVDVDGTQVHYRVEGNPDGPTLVLVHAVLASLQTWDGWVDQLKKDYRIIRMDMPGAGLTGPLVGSNDYSIESQVAFFGRFVDKIGLQQFNLAGNSQGGLVAWMYALEHSQRVEKLILLQPAAYRQDIPGIIQFMSFPVIGDLGSVFAPKIIVSFTARRAYGEPDRLNQRIIDRYYDLSLRKGNRYAMVKVLRQLKAFAKDEKYGSMVPLIKVPTLIQWGERDTWLPKEVLKNWHADLPEAPIIIYPWGGHILMEEVPVQTARDADRFLQGLPIKSNMWIDKTQIRVE